MLRRSGPRTPPVGARVASISAAAAIVVTVVLRMGTSVRCSSGPTCRDAACRGSGRTMAPRWRPPRRRCHLAAVYQRGPNALGEAAAARRIVGILEGHGEVARLAPGTVLDGRPRQEAWVLVP